MESFETVLGALDTGERPHLPKRLVIPRWSSRSEALKSLSQHYKTCRNVLLQKSDTRSEALLMGHTRNCFHDCLLECTLKSIHESSQLL